jgi:hypothetical protein
VIARDLIEEFPPGDAVAAPTSDESAAAAAADAPVGATAPEPETVDELKAANGKLQADNAAMRARIAQLEAPPVENWVELKKVARTPRPSDCEWLRRRCEAQKVEAQKVDGRWFVDANGPRLRACLSRK